MQIRKLGCDVYSGIALQSSLTDASNWGKQQTGKCVAKGNTRLKLFEKLHGNGLLTTEENFEGAYYQYQNKTIEEHDISIGRFVAYDFYRNHGQISQPRGY
jgi:hypothetical protein